MSAAQSTNQSQQLIEQKSDIILTCWPRANRLFETVKDSWADDDDLGMKKVPVPEFLLNEIPQKEDIDVYEYNFTSHLKDMLHKDGLGDTTGSRSNEENLLINSMDSTTSLLNIQKLQFLAANEKEQEVQKSKRAKKRSKQKNKKSNANSELNSSIQSEQPKPLDVIDEGKEKQEDSDEDDEEKTPSPMKLLKSPNNQNSANKSGNQKEKQAKKGDKTNNLEISPLDRRSDEDKVNQGQDADHIDKNLVHIQQEMIQQSISAPILVPINPNILFDPRVAPPPQLPLFHPPMWLVGRTGRGLVDGFIWDSEKDKGMQGLQKRIDKKDIINENEGQIQPEGAIKEDVVRLNKKDIHDDDKDDSDEDDDKADDEDDKKNINAKKDQSHLSQEEQKMQRQREKNRLKKLRKKMKKRKEYEQTSEKQEAPTDDKTKKPDKLETTKVPGGVGKAVEKNNALDTPKSVSRVNVPQPTVIEPCNLCNTGQLQILNLKLISAPFTTGIEENEEFVATPGMLIAQRFRVVEYIGSAAFSQAIECEDIETGDHVCMKIIKNNKEYFDQSVDEIKLLHYVNVHDPEDRFHLVRMYDYFYYKEHLFIMCELLKDNLYEYQKYCNENNLPNYFTIPRLQRIAKQVLEALAFLHSLGLMHCDLKPENILIRSFSRCEVKVIDFGSSCFVTDPLSFYTQSRSYRAPEVILGVPYGRKIDIWSLGCILVEMLTGRVLFLNESLQTLLGRVTAICGQVPPEMLSRAKFRMRYFTPRGMLYELLGVDSDSGVSSDDDDEDDDDEDDDEDGDDEDEEERERKRQMKKNTHKKKTQNQRPKSGEPQYHFLYPKTTTLQQRMHTDDLLFVDFVTRLLTVDPDRRPTAIEALQHPWFNVIYPQSE